jgi:hypothetical protein
MKPQTIRSRSPDPAGVFQFGAVERARQQFADDGFVALWLQAGDELAAFALRVEQATHGAEVAHMHDRAAGARAARPVA